MAEKQIVELKAENYYVVQSWMVTELQLTGHELTVYAVIWGFSQDGNSLCYASVDYFAKWLGTSTRTVKSIIDSLVKKNLITKSIHTNKSGRFNVYTAHRSVVEDSENISPPIEEGREVPARVVKSVQGGSEISANDTLYDNKRNIKDINKDAEASEPQKKRFSKPSYSEIAAYCAERHNTIDPQEFYDYYESIGWYIGKKPMKNWKAAVRTWEQRSKKYSFNNGYPARQSACGHNNPEGFDEF